MFKFKNLHFYLISFLIVLLTSFYLAQAATLSESTSGKILLQVEQNGEAWYVNPANLNRYYLGRPQDAFAIMRDLGIGITNLDLNKIPIATEIQTTGEDTDLDGLSDIFEDAIGTDKNKKDTDNDGFTDKEELEKDYNPLGKGAINTYNNNFINKHKGKIFIQVEAHGEAWYIDPVKLKRYYLGRPHDAFSIMRGRGLGITNENISKVSIKKGYDIKDILKPTSAEASVGKEESETATSTGSSESNNEENEEETDDEEIVNTGGGEGGSSGGGGGSAPAPSPEPEPELEEDIEVPTTPQNLTATPVSSSHISLSWSTSTDNVGVTGYRIYRNGSSLTTTANTAYSNTGLTPSTSYTYRVQAYDAAGNISASSTEASATTEEAVVTSGNSFYVDPVNGDMSNDGSYDHPWRTLQEVFENNLIETREYNVKPYTEGVSQLVIKNAGAPVKAGDTIYLRSGYHGGIDASSFKNTDYITVKAQDGHTPQLRNIYMIAVSKWKFEGLSISPSFAPEYTNTICFDIRTHDWQGPSEDIIFEDNTIYSVEDASGWTAQDWVNNVARGINLVEIDNAIVRNNSLSNISYGIVFSGDNNIIDNNIINHISADAMVCQESNATIQNNIIKNFYAVDDNHDDGIQFHRGGDMTPIDNVIVRGNIIIGVEASMDNPLLRSPQGMHAGDAPLFDSLIENNIFAVDQWHGMSIYNSENTRVLNNTVIDIDPSNEMQTRLMVLEDSHDCIIRNNLAPFYILTETGNTIDHNIAYEDFGDQSLFFVDYLNDDFTTRNGSPAIDAGSADLAPDSDIAGTSRPRGEAYDIGAYEY